MIFEPTKSLNWLTAYLLKLKLRKQNKCNFIKSKAMKTIIIILFSCYGFIIYGQQIEKLGNAQGYSLNGKVFPKFNDLKNEFEKDREMGNKFNRYEKFKKRAFVLIPVSVITMTASIVIGASNSSSSRNGRSQSGLDFVQIPDNVEIMLSLVAISYISGIASITYLIKKGKTKRKLIKLYNDSAPLGLNHKKESHFRVKATSTGLGINLTF